MIFEWESISSRSNPLVVRLGKLKDKKYRKEEGLFRFDGKKLFCEAVENGVELEYVIVSEGNYEKNSDFVVNKLSETDIRPRLVVLSDVAFEKLTEEKAPEGIICVAKYLDKLHVTEDTVKVSEDPLRILMLESVRDAGNLGTIIRCARAFGIDRIIMSADCADLYNSKTIRAAMGALFTQNIVITDSIPSAVCSLKEQGYRVFAAALDERAKKLGSFELEPRDAILIGNEGHGLSPEAIRACDDTVLIPMEEDSESLNAAIAASICMWELYKTKN